MSLISLNLVEGGKIKNPAVPDREHSRSQSARYAVSASLLPSPGSKFVEDNALETKVGTKKKQHTKKSAAFRLISHLFLSVPSSHTPPPRFLSPISSGKAAAREMGGGEKERRGGRVNERCPAEGRGRED